MKKQGCRWQSPDGHKNEKKLWWIANHVLKKQTHFDHGEYFFLRKVGFSHLQHLHNIWQ